MLKGPHADDVETDANVIAETKRLKAERPSSRRSARRWRRRGCSCRPRSCARCRRRLSGGAAGRAGGGARAASATDVAALARASEAAIRVAPPPSPSLPVLEQLQAEVDRICSTPSTVRYLGDRDGVKAMQEAVAAAWWRRGRSRRRRSSRCARSSVGRGDPRRRSAGGRRLDAAGRRRAAVVAAVCRRVERVQGGARCRRGHAETNRGGDLDREFVGPERGEREGHRRRRACHASAQPHPRSLSVPQGAATRRRRQERTERRRWERRRRGHRGAAAQRRGDRRGGAAARAAQAARGARGGRMRRVPALW